MDDTSPSAQTLAKARSGTSGWRAGQEIGADNMTKEPMTPQAQELIDRARQWLADFNDETRMIGPIVLIRDLLSLLAAQSAQIEELKVDAERYRWLRNVKLPYTKHGDVSCGIQEGNNPSVTRGISGVSLDAAIDAAKQGAKT